VLLRFKGNPQISAALEKAQAQLRADGEAKGVSEAKGASDAKAAEAKGRALVGESSKGSGSVEPKRSEAKVVSSPARAPSQGVPKTGISSSSAT
jgi:hypothetical protein